MSSSSKKNRNSKAKVVMSSSRQVLVIDNAPLREGAIRIAGKWLKKIENVEESAKNFRDIDLKLYTDWSNLTLGPFIERLEESRQEFLKVAAFHNVMVMVAMEKKITVPAAYIVLMDEEAQYENGDFKTRAKIEERRAQRMERLEREMGYDFEQTQSRSRKAQEEYEEDLIRQAQKEEQRAERERAERAKNRGQQKQKDENDFDNDQFEENIYNERVFQTKKAKPSLSEDDTLRVKSLFRKIVRRIHPDHLDLEENKSLKSWFQIIWKNVADAHEKSDLKKLTLLYHKTVLALKDYDELSVSELKSAAESLEGEFDELLDQHSNLKDSPAWNFSKVKNYDKLAKEQSKPYRQQQRLIDEEIEIIKDQRAEIERIARLMKDGKVQMNRSRRGGSTGRRKGRRY
ncbi:MAG: hypothetical protein H7256_16145 [Bdellovibrio sp.]|nr:hypothetical protein [Bdellovibrio sp.]